MNVYKPFMVVLALLLIWCAWNFGERQVRVVYTDKDPYDLPGWYVEIRGQGYFFWTRAHPLPFTGAAEAHDFAYEHAKSTKGCVVWK